MTKYQITNRTSGTDLGTYDAGDPTDAVEALHRDAGYADMLDAAKVLGTTVESLRADLIVTEVS